MNELIIGKQLINVNNAKIILSRFLATLLFSCLILYGLKDYPTISILLVDTLFCCFLASIFNYRLAFLFLLHPIVLLILSLFFKTPFLQLGDGPAYQAIFNQFFNSYGLGINGYSFFLSDSLFEDLKYLNLGVVPIFIIPEHLYGLPGSNVYYFWQGTFHVILVSVCILFSKIWRVTRDDYLFFIALFAVISPSFFELGITPTRHIVTFFFVFLFYISFIAIYQKFSVAKLTVLTTAIAGVAISKFALFIPIFIFCTYYAFSSSSYKLTVKSSLFVLIIFSLIFMSLGHLNFTFVNYEDISKEGGETFSQFTQLPILGIFFKYLFALLSPFPWQKAVNHIEIIYGGNVAIFLMHMISSLLGIYLFVRMFVYWKPLFQNYPDIRPLLMYGFIMSLSILKGATGFHTYLLIYFPFLAPLFAIKKFQLSWLLPICIVLSAEATYTICSYFLKI